HSEDFLTVNQEISKMPKPERLAFRAIIYETFAIVVVYLLSRWWFEDPPEQTLEYTALLFVVLCIYYFVFHYIFAWIGTLS
ncbi:MAG TPA: chlorhexidine efflux transporter, partial [Saprospiraceae bacterium]|nr:chlorhexidine efflux transporter [Saprospiraceae bacterium]